MFSSEITWFILYLTALGLHCCTWAFSNCSKWGTAVLRLLITVASLVEGLGHMALRSFKLMSPALVVNS